MWKSKLLNALIVLVVVFAFSFIMGWGYDSARGAPKTNGAIGGKVQVSRGSSAGVWVIADTTQVLKNNGSPGHFRKIVVTDDKGNFLIPDLPPATYDVWVRGYGLADSTPVSVTPGNNVTLHADLASSPQEAAQIYPGSYWYSLFEPPPVSDFPGTGPSGNGIPTSFQRQAAWVDSIKLGCELCHQIGNAETRDLLAPLDWDEAWNLAATMNGTANGLGRQVAAQLFADWADRIDAGEVPPSPPRPQGIERNVVITQWEWGDQFTYAHDEVATDKRHPDSVNQYGNVYGVDLGNDYLNVTNPVTNVSSRVHIPTLNGFSTPWCAQAGGFCTWNVYVNPANPHNPMIDDTGKVWITTQIRNDANRPAFCSGAPNPTTPAGFPNATGGHRQAGYYEIATGNFVLLDTCFGTHHLEFDNNGIVWFSGDSNVIGWINPSKLSIVPAPTPPASNAGISVATPGSLEMAEGWSRVEVNNGGLPADPATHLSGFHYGINVNPVDGSIWTGVLSAFPGRIERYNGSTSPPPFPFTNANAQHEAYNPPCNGLPESKCYHGPRGVDIDTHGIVWVGLGGSGTLASFDRSQCKTTAGTGDQCPEGWTTYQYTDSPQMQGVTSPGTADFHYLIFVDQHNASGLGENTVFLTGTGSDSLIAFNQTTKKFSIIRIPYPLVAYMRGLDGRIDDASAGWKGRGLWVDYGIDPIKHTETGIGQIYHVQFRPSPLDQ